MCMCSVNLRKGPLNNFQKQWLINYSSVDVVKTAINHILQNGYAQADF